MYIGICIYIYICIQWRAKSFIQNAGKLSWTPFPRRVLDIIFPSRWSNIGAVKPFNIISLLVPEITPPSFSMGIARSSQPNLEEATPLLRHVLDDDFGFSLLSWEGIWIKAFCTGEYITTCLTLFITQVFFKSGEECSEWWWSLPRRNTHKTNEACIRQVVLD